MQNLYIFSSSVNMFLS